MTFINCIGPPASGKSTFAAKYVLEHPEFTYISIDEYRLEYQDEELAWGKLTAIALENRNIIFETCGLSWRLKDLFCNETIRRRPFLTIAFIGKPEVIHKRLSERQKREIPRPYHWTEHESIDFVLANIAESVAPIDFQIDVTEKTEEEVYLQLASIIAEKRIVSLGDRTRRNEQYGTGFLAWG